LLLGPFVHYMPNDCCCIDFCRDFRDYGSNKIANEEKINRLININYSGAHLIYLYFFFMRYATFLLTPVL